MDADMGWGKINIASAFALAVMASPALAQGSIAIPEPTDLALFGLAVAGLFIGRRSSKAPPYERPKDSGDA
jgi:PEP-CTERM motif